MVKSPYLYIFVFFFPLHLLRICRRVGKAKTLSCIPSGFAFLSFRFIGRSLHQNQTIYLYRNISKGVNIEKFGLFYLILARLCTCATVTFFRTRYISTSYPGSLPTPGAAEKTLAGAGHVNTNIFGGKLKIT